MALADILKADGFDGAEIVHIADAVDAVLHDSTLCSLGSVTLADGPHINTAYFAHVGDLVFYILTAPSSLHAKCWEADPRVAMAIFSSSQPWGVPHRGLQMNGAVARIPDREHGDAFEAYAHAHPGLRGWARDGAELLATLESRLYAIEIQRLKISDEARFGEEPISATVQRRNRQSRRFEIGGIA